MGGEGERALSSSRRLLAEGGDARPCGHRVDRRGELVERRGVDLACDRPAARPRRGCRRRSRFRRPSAVSRPASDLAERVAQAPAGSPTACRGPRGTRTCPRGAGSPSPTAAGSRARAATACSDLVRRGEAGAEVHVLRHVLARRPWHLVEQRLVQRLVALRVVERLQRVELGRRSAGTSCPASR